MRGSNSINNGRRRGLLAAAVVCAAVLAPASSAGSPGDAAGAFVPPSLREAARADQARTFRVIVQGTRGTTSSAIGRHVAQTLADQPGAIPGRVRQFTSIPGAAAELTGRQLLALAERRDVFAITEDAPVRLSGSSNRQKWPYVAGVAKAWTLPYALLPVPTIAIVDSGVDASRPDLAGRVVREVNLTTLVGNSPGDGRGHGTFVASLAAGNAPGYAGALPTAKLVSIDVTDDRGMARTSDVIAAADWILANKATYGIRVANFSLHSATPSSFRYDPLDRAVVRLWFSGGVVVAAAGNYAEGGAVSGVRYAPANDPFIITVGAGDIRNSVAANDDIAAPWSAYGYTADGFRKPELGAPGRYLVAAVPPLSTLALERPDRMVAPGYIQLSGTSFAAPIVAGAAAFLLGLHPEWTPDQVKGALMQTARPTPNAAPGSEGVGEVNAAAAINVTLPINPNRALNRFLVADASGGLPVFDTVSWTDAALADPAWDSVSWTDVSWTDVSWTDVSWTDVSWTDEAFTSVSWTDVSWTDTSFSDSSWETSADSDVLAGGGYWISPEELAAAEAELGIGG